ncbi:hypothetical protein DU508_18405 [Pedobacter chinensis]|uniref:Uncharacterized protein n=1 Tax=Pedobacter chinensis TaxID=2282421 RepID=A0A369PRG9_9SPHI|nr:hypothetical protein [Pedobacter chinensis]RDC55123.1 hypothetical protein DU508_18405 [Pedobacter chinensis]
MKNCAPNLSLQKLISKNLLLFALILIFSCKKDKHEESIFENKNTTQLNQWYNGLIQQQDQSIFLYQLKPDWGSVYISKHNGQTVYEINCKNPNKFTFGKELTDDTKKQAQFEHTTIKLLLFQNSDNILSGAFMMIKATGNITKKLNYKDLPGFTGTVIYYTLTGKFANGWVYNSGNITHTIAPATDADLGSIKINADHTAFDRGEKLMLENINCVISAQPVYGQQCITIDPIPEIPESQSYTTCVWVIVDVSYTVQCYSTGGSEGGSGGGGYNPPVTPPPTVPEDPPKPDPCAKAKALNENTNYKDETNDLKNKVADVNLQREVGYIKKVGSPAVYSDPGTTGMLFNIPQIGELTDHSLEYITHTHYVDSTALSIFGFDDFFTFGKFLGSNKVADVNTFSLGVTTSYGTYTLVLDDWNIFNSYLQDTINDFSNSLKLYQSFNAATGGILETNSGSINEINLLKILKNSGIKLLKKDSSTGNFKVLTLDANGNLVIINCSGVGTGSVE